MPGWLSGLLAVAVKAFFTAITAALRQYRLDKEREALVRAKALAEAAAAAGERYREEAEALAKPIDRARADDLARRLSKRAITAD